MAALSDFSSSYNSSHTVNVKKVKAVEKAWRELEKSSWFQHRREIDLSGREVSTPARRCCHNRMKEGTENE
jgi:hypothetical protein